MLFRGSCYSAARVIPRLVLFRGSVFPRLGLLRGFDYTSQLFTNLTTIRRLSSSYGVLTACYTEQMTLPIPAVQQALKKDGLDGWLLYDFHGSNPIARRLADLVSSSKLSTRRWYYLVPAEGMPRGLVHAIERHIGRTLPRTEEPRSRKTVCAWAGRRSIAPPVRKARATRSCSVCRPARSPSR